MAYPIMCHSLRPVRLARHPCPSQRNRRTSLQRPPKMKMKHNNSGSSLVGALYQINPTSWNIHYPVLFLYSLQNLFLRPLLPAFIRYNPNYCLQPAILPSASSSCRFRTPSTYHCSRIVIDTTIVFFFGYLQNQLRLSPRGRYHSHDMGVMS